MKNTQQTQNTVHNSPRNKKRLFDIFLNSLLVLMLIWFTKDYYGLLYTSTVVKDESKAKIIMYSTKWCPACIQSKAYFNKHGIAYYNYDINKSQDAMSQFKNLGGRGVPLFLIDNKLIHGANKDRLSKLLKIR